MSRRAAWRGVVLSAVAGRWNPGVRDLVPLDLVERQLDRGLPAEDLDQALDLLRIRVDLVDGRLQGCERAVDDGNRVADLEVEHLDLGRCLGVLALYLRGKRVEDLAEGQRHRLVAVPDE